MSIRQTTGRSRKLVPIIVLLEDAVEDLTSLPSISNLANGKMSGVDAENRMARHGFHPGRLRGVVAIVSHIVALIDGTGTPEVGTTTSATGMLLVPLHRQ